VVAERFDELAVASQMPVVPKKAPLLSVEPETTFRVSAYPFIVITCWTLRQPGISNVSVVVLPTVKPVIQKLLNVAMPDASVLPVRVPPRVPADAETSVMVRPEVLRLLPVESCN
jgi:hypothetical protein